MDTHLRMVRLPTGTDTLLYLSVVTVLNVATFPGYRLRHLLGQQIVMSDNIM